MRTLPADFFNFLESSLWISHIPCLVPFRYYRHVRIRVSHVVFDHSCLHGFALTRLIFCQSAPGLFFYSRIGVCCHYNFKASWLRVTLRIWKTTVVYSFYSHTKHLVGNFKSLSGYRQRNNLKTLLKMLALIMMMWKQLMEQQRFRSRAVRLYLCQWLRITSGDVTSMSLKQLPWDLAMDDIGA